MTKDPEILVFHFSTDERATEDLEAWGFGKAADDALKRYNAAKRAREQERKENGLGRGRGRDGGKGEKGARVGAESRGKAIVNAESRGKAIVKRGLSEKCDNVEKRQKQE
ncbi:hypothetical protein HDU93_001932 [Gonapodya sp. JEL0774]|nr:hypothetical protein HDU93_001932 [Gonapodya sp. JEL0774]